MKRIRILLMAGAHAKPADEEVTACMVKWFVTKSIQSEDPQSNIEV